MLKRVAFFTYGCVAYLGFLGTFLYAVGFIGNFGIPTTTLDDPATGPLGQALAIDVGLLALFALQHSVMARPWFKEHWTRIIPRELERSTYVLFSSLALVALFLFWQPIGLTIWSIESPVARGIVYGLFGLGWTIVLLATFLINHFDLFGLRQVSLFFAGRPYTRLPFATPLLYRIVRHPLYVGWLFAFWSAPTMTAAHLLFAVMTTGYILTAIQLEEHDLVEEHGENYRAYRRRVPMLIPLGKRGTRCRVLPAGVSSRSVARSVRPARAPGPAPRAGSRSGELERCRSVREVEDVPHDRPSPRGRRCIPAEDPVIVERFNRAVALLQLEPRVHEREPSLIATRCRIRDRQLIVSGLRDDDAVSRMEQCQYRPALGGRMYAMTSCWASNNSSVRLSGTSCSPVHAPRAPRQNGRSGCQRGRPPAP